MCCMSLEIVVGDGGGRGLVWLGLETTVEGRAFVWGVIVGERVFSFFVVVDGRGVEKGSVEAETTAEATLETVTSVTSPNDVWPVVVPYTCSVTVGRSSTSKSNVYSITFVGGGCVVVVSVRSTNSG